MIFTPYCRSSNSIIAASLALILLGSSSQTYACSLEPTLNGGFTVGYPGSIEVAIAVANAREEGLLQQPDTAAMPSDIQLQLLLSDLRRLQVRLVQGLKDVQVAKPRSFSVLLVGPSLWSEFHMANSVVLANYHTTGPLLGRGVVMTHSSVLVALLDGSIDADRAEKLGLIRYAGMDTDVVRKLFHTEFQSQKLLTRTLNY